MDEDMIHSLQVRDGIGMEKEVTRINKRHMARLLDVLEEHGQLNPYLRADIMRSFNFLLEDTVVAIRTDTGKENHNGCEPNQPSCELGR